MSGIATAARVAALRERAARARFAAAGVRSLAAADAVRISSAQLATHPDPSVGTADDLSAWRSGAELRVQAVRSAEGDAQQAADDKAAALAEWQELSRRREALDEVLARWRQGQQAKADATAQRLMDDLGRRRKEWS
jgi:DNA-binding transcriptional regulator YbjK